MFMDISLQTQTKASNQHEFSHEVSECIICSCQNVFSCHIPEL